MFAALLDNLKMKGGGIHGYAALAESAKAQAKVADDKAAAYYIIAMAAESFVETYERMPLSTQVLVESSNAITHHIQQIDTAYAENDPAVILKSLHQMSHAFACKV